MSESKNEMKTPFSIQPELFKELLKQGISYLIIAIIAFVFFDKSESCNERVILMYEKDRKELIESRAKDREDKREMIRIIESHTRALQSFSEILISKR